MPGASSFPRCILPDSRAGRCTKTHVFTPRCLRWTVASYGRAGDLRSSIDPKRLADSGVGCPAVAALGVVLAHVRDKLTHLPQAIIPAERVAFFGGGVRL